MRAGKGISKKSFRRRGQVKTGKGSLPSAAKKGFLGDSAGGADSIRLAVDIGNTHTVLGLFRGDSIRRRWRVATRKDTTVDEIVFWLRGLAAKETDSVEQAALASVVPAQDEHWMAALGEAFQVQPQVLDHRNCLGLKLEYEIPRQIGADRLANVLGAEALGIREGVVIDFGTATTFDVFADRTYYGGVICPGIQSSMHTLAQSAAKLAEAELRWPGRAVGRNTDDAMRIGILSGTVGMVERLLGEIFREKPFVIGATSVGAIHESPLRRSPLRRRPMVIATGGLAFWMRNRTRTIQRFEPDLTLMGINRLMSGPRPASGKGKRRIS